MLGSGGCGGRTGRCWRDGTAWARGEGPALCSAQPKPPPPPSLICTFSSLTKGRLSLQCRRWASVPIGVAALEAAGAAGAAPRQGITSPTQRLSAVLAAEVVLVPALSLCLRAAQGENQLGEGEGSFIHSFVHSFIHPITTPYTQLALKHVHALPFGLLRHSWT
jgi:hypothetical protein